MNVSSSHQKKQIEVIDQIEKEIKENSLKSSTVSPVKDWENDPRICLTSIHLPHKNLLKKIQELVINPLRELSPEFYYYPNESFHMTIKNIRIINEPPHFGKEDIEKAKKVFSKIIVQHKRFNVYFYRLLLFPNSLALIGTADLELSRIFLDLDKELKDAGIPDDKIYTNAKYFFSNMTLVRFANEPSRSFKNKIQEISNSFYFDPYTVDSVVLLTGNAVLKNYQIIASWNLQ